MSRHSVFYGLYMDSREWDIRRAGAIIAADYRCQHCGRGDCQLQVHHLTYERLGNEAYGDLMVLCTNCHEKHHFYRMSLRPTRQSEATRRRMIATQQLDQPDAETEVVDHGTPDEFIDEGGWLDAE